MSGFDFDFDLALEEEEEEVMEEEEERDIWKETLASDSRWSSVKPDHIHRDHLHMCIHPDSERGREGERKKVRPDSILGTRGCCSMACFILFLTIISSCNIRASSFDSMYIRQTYIHRNHMVSM